MNVAIFTDTFLPKIDGVAISVDHFCRYLSARGHKFIICCPKYGSDDIKVLGDDIEILRFKNAPLPSYPDIKVVLPSLTDISDSSCSLFKLSFKVSLTSNVQSIILIFLEKIFLNFFN